MSEYSDRLLGSIRNRQREGLQTVEVSEAQVALVARALADHTLLMSALKFNPDAGSPWPEATSLGRFFHHLADELQPPFAGPTQVDPVARARAVRALVEDAWVGHDDELALRDLDRLAEVVLTSVGFTTTKPTGGEQDV